MQPREATRPSAAAIHAPIGGQPGRVTVRRVPGVRPILPILLTAAVSSMLACLPDKHPEVDWMKPPKAYDPINTEGLTLNKAGVDTLTLKEGDERDAYIESLKGEGTFKGQAKCQSGSNTGDLEPSKWGEFQLSCEAGAILFDIELKYRLFTTREAGKPLSANAYVAFTGTLVEFSYHDDSKPRSIMASVKLDELDRIPR